MPSRSRLATVTAAAFIAHACFATAAMAIPSPELIIGSAASLSQIGALIAATFGGSAVLAGAKGARGGRAMQLVLVGLVALVGLLTMALVAIVHQHGSERQARLEATIIRPARQPGQDIADPSLKELSFEEQVRHPLGVATDEAARVIAAGDADPDLIVVDARNEAETEMGGIAAPRILKLLDFKVDDPANLSKRFVFFCHNGNRSFETCEAARAKGVDCRFIVGGLEKWVVEQRPMSGLQARGLADLRAIPDYPGRGRLLDTGDVKALIADRRAHVIDVRYPGDFARGHMAGAINVPLRRMTRADLEAVLAPLDRTRPVVLPCYDRRSCFFADVMGLNLSRAGFDVAGRYTTAYEYFLPSPRPPHVEAWIAAQNTTSWQRTRETLAGLLAQGGAWIGLPLMLLALATLSRLAVWPFTAKSERDQIVARQTADEIARLKLRLAADPVRLRRALFAHAKRHNLTPLRNLLGLLFLPLLALATLAAGDAAALAPQSWLWLADLAHPDPRAALPVLVALFLTLYCVAVFAVTHRQQIATALIGFPLLTLTMAPLPAASSLYVLFSTLLLVAQRAYVVRLPQRAIAAVRLRLNDLRERRLGGARLLTTPLTPGAVGNKAARLSVLTAQGFPVPAALVLDDAAVGRLAGLSTVARCRQAKRLAAALGGNAFAVRSSGAGEDSASASFAGVFESELGVSRDGLDDAIGRVARSFHAARVSAYASGTPAGGHIIVQRMLAPRFAGVLFTQAPDAPGQMLIELVEGTGDALASGRQTPRNYRVGRLTRRVIGDAPPLDLGPLIELAHRCATLFGRPQDIEWAFADGRFHLLQSRDIVASPGYQAAATQVDQVIARALQTGRSVFEPDAPLYRASPMAELLPRPTTLSLDVLNALWGPGGSVDLAARRLDLNYHASEHEPAHFIRVNGRLVADVAVTSDRALRMSARARTRLLKQAARIAGEIEAKLPAVRADAVLIAALDLQHLAFPELMAHWQRQLDGFLTTVHPLAETANILAGVVLDASSGANTNATPTIRPGWHGELIAAMQLPDQARVDALRRIAGHRSNLDYELAHPRWSEVPGAIAAFAITVRAHTAPPPSPSPGSLAALALLKEDAKHEMLRAFANLRRTLLELDRRVGLGGHIFELSLDEVAALSGDTRERAQVAARERRHLVQHLLTESPPPTTLTARDVELLGTDQFGTFTTATPASLGASEARCKGRGTRVSGRNEVAGRVFVATAAQAEAGLPLDEFRERDVLVTPLVHPDWLSIVLKSGGVVADTGGWLSHMAIVAREHGVAMIVGVPNAGQFRTGDRVRLLADGRVLADGEAGKLALVAAK